MGDLCSLLVRSLFSVSQFELLVDGLLVLVEQDLPSGGHSAPVVALKMGKVDSKALDLSVTNWSSQVSGVLHYSFLPIGPKL